MSGAVSGLLAPSALLPTGWHPDVEICWGPDGMLESVTPNVPDSPHPTAAGPVIPGMPNLHSHAFQRALLGRVQHPGPGGDFWSWRNEMYSAVQALTPELLYQVSAWTYSLMLAAGYTSVVEFHYVHRLGGASPSRSLEAMMSAARDTGIRQTLAPVLYRFAGADGTALSERQRAFELDHAEFADLVTQIGEAGTTVAIAPHSLRAVQPDDLHFLVDLVGADTPVHIHVSEQPAEVAEIRKNLGDTPIAWLNREFGLSPRWALVHATQATPAELDLIDDGAATLVLCPTTEHDLGDGRFPIERTPGASCGVGSDSQVSVSPAEELRLLLYGQRAAQGKRAVLSPTDYSDGSSLWQRATQGASVVTGSPVGRIVEGHAADLMVLDGARPDFTGLTADHLLSAWVLSGHARQIAEVRVGGAVVAQHGTHVDHNELAEGARAALSVLRS